ncbi:MAG: PAS domain-containing protein, partial [Solirubrobacteraceae bacterium]
MSSHDRAPSGTSDFHRATLDSLEECVAVLDADGRTIAVNAALDRFARSQPRCELRPGANYLAACEARGAAGDRDRAAVAASLREMLAGEAEGFTARYA